MYEDDFELGFNFLGRDFDGKPVRVRMALTFSYILRLLSLSDITRFLSIL